jgi:hypothetical protein
MLSALLTGHWIAAGRMTGFVSLTKWRRFFSATAPKPAREAGALPNQCDPRHPWLLQKQTHAVEVDDGMTDVQHIHPKNAADHSTALLPYEIWQCSYAEFVRRHFEIADGQIVNSRSTNWLRSSAGKTSGDPCRF